MAMEVVDVDTEKVKNAERCYLMPSYMVQFAPFGGICGTERLRQFGEERSVRFISLSAFETVTGAHPRSLLLW